MSFDRADLEKTVLAHERVVRVVIASIKGSSPREVGAAMLVWDDGQSGTIGGGALEFQAAQAARKLSKDATTTHPLGPELGQCCGGTVTLLSEVFEMDRVTALPQDVIARGPHPQPIKVASLLSKARKQGSRPAPQWVNGWMIEPVLRPTRSVWIWGAGHVGRAFVDVFAPMPDLHITWADTHQNRFPKTIPDAVDCVVGKDLETLAAYAPPNAEHFILTYSHEIDLALCHALLHHGFQNCGLIGSKTKWARFQKRLSNLGHTPDSIQTITCPIGDPALGKHPQAIAIGVAHSLLTAKPETLQQERRA